MSTINIFFSVKALINTLVRMTPVGLYTGSALSGLVFDDFRGLLLLLGFILNEAIALGYRLIMRGVYNPQCALSRTDTDYFVLPSPITQTVGFFYGFYLMDMYNKGVFEPGRFFIMTIIVALTIFSRVNVGCKSFVEALYCTVLGMILGLGYYNAIKKYYKPDFYKLQSVDDTVDDFFRI